MHKISDLISMPIISIYESNYIGIIKNTYFDNNQKKCKYLLIENENKEYSEILDINNIHLIGKDCIFIKNKSELILESNIEKELKNLSMLINKNVYSIDGDFLGICTDIIINKNYTIVKIILNNKKEIEKSKILNIGNVIVISDKKINQIKFKPKINTILSTEIIDKSVKIQEDKKDYKINNIITDYRLLVGRILNKNIYAINGETLARKGTLVTKELINKASMYGKLIEISRYSEKK